MRLDSSASSLPKGYESWSPYLAIWASLIKGVSMLQQNQDCWLGTSRLEMKRQTVFGDIFSTNCLRVGMRLTWRSTMVFFFHISIPYRGW